MEIENTQENSMHDEQHRIADYEEQLRDFERKNSEYKEQIAEYKIQIKDLIDKSNELFEKQFIYVAAGTLAASVFIIDKFLKGVQYGFILILICWALCGASIVLNLLSHYFAMRSYKKTYDDINMNTFDHNKADSRGSKIALFNTCSVIVYALGLVSFIIYICLNLNSMNKLT